MAPRFLVPWKRTLEVHESCGAHASGLGAESMGTANTRREKSLLMNRMAYARKQISRNGKRKWEKESQVKLLLPKFHRADSALRSQAAGGVGACASVAPPAFGCRLG